MPWDDYEGHYFVKDGGLLYPSDMSASYVIHSGPLIA